MLPTCAACEPFGCKALARGATKRWRDHLGSGSSPKSSRLRSTMLRVRAVVAASSRIQSLGRMLPPGKQPRVWLRTCCRDTRHLRSAIRFGDEGRHQCGKLVEVFHPCLALFDGAPFWAARCWRRRASEQARLVIGFCTPPSIDSSQVCLAGARKEEEFEFVDFSLLATSQEHNGCCHRSTKIAERERGLDVYGASSVLGADSVACASLPPEISFARPTRGRRAQRVSQPR